MKHLAILLLVLPLPAPTPVTPKPAGALIVIGGGRTPKEAVARAVELAGGQEAVVAILPHASQRVERGVGSAEMFREAGVAEALVLDDLTAPTSRTDLRRASLVWMPGGSQRRLMEAVEAADLTELLRERHRSGVVFGGTSAGAAVQSKLMITGKAELETVVARGTELVSGLGLWPEVIVDQHALKRRRLQRLLSAVLDHPEKVGVAIDEGTAVVVEDERLEVLGASNVVVLDARRARVAETKEGAPHAAQGVTLHLLRAGDALRLEEDD